MKRWPTEPVAPSTPGQLLGRELGIVEGLRTALLLGESGASVGEEAFGHCVVVVWLKLSRFASTFSAMGAIAGSRLPEVQTHYGIRDIQQDKSTHDCKRRESARVTN
jgi:hypothetical protein